MSTNLKQIRSLIVWASYIVEPDHLIYRLFDCRTQLTLWSGEWIFAHVSFILGPMYCCFIFFIVREISRYIFVIAREIFQCADSLVHTNSCYKRPLVSQPCVRFLDLDIIGFWCCLAMTWSWFNSVLIEESVNNAEAFVYGDLCHICLIGEVLKHQPHDWKEFGLLHRP